MRYWILVLAFASRVAFAGVTASALLGGSVGGRITPPTGGRTLVFNCASFGGTGCNSSSMTTASSATFSSSVVELTQAASTPHQAGALWYDGKQNIQSFTSDFSFQITGGATLNTSASTSSGDVLTFSSTAGVTVGQSVTGTNIPGATYVQSVTSTTVTMNNSVSGTVSSGEVITFGGGYGMAFVVQNDGRTLANTSADANGMGYLQYSTNPAGTAIGNSIAIAFNATPASASANYYPGAAPSTIELFVDGGPYEDGDIYPLQDALQQAINFESGDEIAGHIVYDGTNLSVTLTDLTTNAVGYWTWPVNIPSVVGANTAYVGFTAGTLPNVNQNLIGWTWYSGYDTRLSAPTFSPAAGSYTSSQSVTLGCPSGATCYYTTNGKPPTTASTQYTGAITVSSNELVQAIATESGYTTSTVAQGNYQIQSSSSPFLNFASGFASANGLIQTAGYASISGSNLQLTDTSFNGEVAGAWYAVPVNIQTFTTVFTLKFTSASANGAAFVLQNVGATTPLASPGYPYAGSATVSGGPAAFSIGGNNLAYAGIGNSIAVKFDVFNSNSTGLYVGGAVPGTTGQVAITGITLSSGDPIQCTLTYNGTTLSLSMEDLTTLGTFSTSWTVNIPSDVGANTAYAGFTASTGGQTANQQVTSWTYHN